MASKYDAAYSPAVILFVVVRHTALAIHSCPAMPRKSIVPLLLLVSGILFAPARGEDKRPPANDRAAAEQQAAFGKFLRVVRSDDGEPVAMETSISRYVPKGGDREGLSVELVSAVHVGEVSYYEALNKAFNECDVVLYELVAPEGSAFPREREVAGGCDFGAAERHEGHARSRVST